MNSTLSKQCLSLTLFLLLSTSIVAEQNHNSGFFMRILSGTGHVAYERKTTSSQTNAPTDTNVIDTKYKGEIAKNFRNEVTLGGIVYPNLAVHGGLDFGIFSSLVRNNKESYRGDKDTRSHRYVNGVLAVKLLSHALECIY